MRGMRSGLLWRRGCGGGGRRDRQWYGPKCFLKGWGGVAPGAWRGAGSKVGGWRSSATDWSGFVENLPTHAEAAGAHPRAILRWPAGRRRPRRGPETYRVRGARALIAFRWPEPVPCWRETASVPRVRRRWRRRLQWCRCKPGKAGRPARHRLTDHPRDRRWARRMISPPASATASTALGRPARCRRRRRDGPSTASERRDALERVG
jgi:hypothetical protein